MPNTRYIQVKIDGQSVDLKSSEEVPVSISYKLEDPDNFQSKKSSEAFNINIPATTNNDQVSNTFHNPSIEDLSEGSVFRSHRPVVIEANSCELLVGKAFLVSARHASCPISYQYNFYGNNGDWIIDLKEKTLFDYLRHINFTFTKEHIVNSWAFDGTNEELPYVFAPVRYGRPMDTKYLTELITSGFPPAEHEVVVGELPDYNMKPEYMRPALSKYWIIYWAFKSLGYKIESTFFNTPYFRRQTMPWTWGNFLFSDGTRLDNLDFLAKSTGEKSLLNQDISTIWDLDVSNDSHTGAFDNNGVYEYDSVNKEMKWTYLPAFDYGLLEGTFHFQAMVRAVATSNSDVELRLQWFKNGVKLDNGVDNGNGTLLVELNAPSPGRRDFTGIVENWLTIPVEANDVISAKVYVHTFDSGTGIARIHAEVLAFELDYFRIPLGGQIDFENYSGFKKYKFLDLLAGVVDEFNLSIMTDPINKVVLIEPTHPYSLTTDLSAQAGGYFNGNWIDWSEKQDLSVESEMDLFSDSERDLLLRYKEDSNDGILKTVQDRSLSVAGLGKFVFPNRFKAGKKEMENRFFSPVMHYDVDQWKSITGIAPQLICLVPENVSNTSRDEAQNTFDPKSAYYKGLVSGVGGWVFDGEEMEELPFMFAVNYKAGGQSDPVLSYCDERIGPSDDYVLAKGLIRRFFLQRLAILRNGVYYNTPFRVNNFDVMNWFRREHIVCRGQLWELVEIQDYKPLITQSTTCTLRKWAPVTEADSDNTFPSEDSVLDTGEPLEQNDIPYTRRLGLSSDISKA